MSRISQPPRIIGGTIVSIDAVGRTVVVNVGLDADGNARTITARIPGGLTVGAVVPVVTSDAGAFIVTTG